MTLRPLALAGGLLTALGTVVGALLDPAFLVSHPDLLFSLGFTVVKGGQELAPNLPWNQIIIVLVTGSLVLTAAKIHDKRTQS